LLRLLAKWSALRKKLLLSLQCSLHGLHAVLGHHQVIRTHALHATSLGCYCSSAMPAYCSRAAAAACLLLLIGGLLLVQGGLHQRLHAARLMLLRLLLRWLLRLLMLLLLGSPAARGSSCCHAAVSLKQKVAQRAHRGGLQEQQSAQASAAWLIAGTHTLTQPAVASRVQLLSAHLCSVIAAPLVEEGVEDVCVLQRVAQAALASLAA
jgi:hypothetical protein